MLKQTNQTVTKDVSATEFAQRVQIAIQKSQANGKPFLIILLQLANMSTFRAQRPTSVVISLMRELEAGIRKSVHPSQYVGRLHDGLGFVFEGMEVGQADILARRLVMIAQSIIKNGKFNDLSSRWSDILYQFLFPNKPGILLPCVGWSVYPRDGMTGNDLVKRALHHLAELRR